MLTGPPRVEEDPAPSESEPDTFSVAEESVVRPSTESLAVELIVTIPEPVRPLITAVSELVGTTPPTQLAVLFQSPPLGAFAVPHVIMDSTIRSSRPSMIGLKFLDRLRLVWRRTREEPKSSTLLRSERFMESHPVPQRSCKTRRGGLGDRACHWSRS